MRLEEREAVSMLVRKSWLSSRYCTSRSRRFCERRQCMEEIVFVDIRVSYFKPILLCSTSVGLWPLDKID